MNWGTASLRQLSVLGPQYGANAGAIERSGKRPRYIRITDIRADGQLLNDGAVEADLPDDNEFALEDGDLLFARSGNTVGKTYRYKKADGPAVFAGYLIRFQLNRELVDSRYVFFYTQSAEYKQWLLRKRRVGGQPNVNGAEYASLELPLAPISEQRRIVSLLEQADGLRRQRALVNQSADRVLPALFYKMFGDPGTNSKGWPVEPLGKMAKVQCGFAFKSEDFVESGTLLVRIGNLVDGLVRMGGGSVYLPNEFYQRHESFKIENGDLLIALSGATTGKLARYDLEQTQALLNQRVGRFLVRNAPRSTLDYLDVLLHTAYARNLISMEMQGGGQPNLAPRELEALAIPRPPDHLLNEFETHTKAFRRLVNNCERATENLENLFATMLHHAFTGELTAKWREAHLKELLVEMEHQAKLLRTAAETN